MRRRVGAVLVLLMLGAIVNVAVAWACAWAIRPDYRMRGSSWKYDHFSGRANDDPVLRHYGAHRWRKTGALRVHVVRYSSTSGPPPPQRTPSFDEIVPRWSLNFISPPELGGQQPGLLDVENFDNSSALVDARGWPMLSMGGAKRVVSPSLRLFLNGRPVQLESTSYGLYSIDDLGVPARDQRNIPLRPLAPGFIINTVFYAALLWLLFFAPFTARRLIRRRRGQCERCAYPIGTSSVCTECGAAVTERTR